MQESLLKQSSVAEPISILLGNAIQVEWISKVKQFSIWTWCLSTFQGVLLCASSTLLAWTEMLTPLGGTRCILSPLHDVNEGTESGE